MTAVTLVYGDGIFVYNLAALLLQSGAIINKSPLKNIERITPNIYNLDVGGYFVVFINK